MAPVEPVVRSFCDLPGNEQNSDGDATARTTFPVDLIPRPVFVLQRMQHLLMPTISAVRQFIGRAFDTHKGTMQGLDDAEAEVHATTMYLETVKAREHPGMDSFGRYT